LAETLSHYRLLNKLGTGGMGTVFCAQDSRTGQTVAVKALRSDLAENPSFVRRFKIPDSDGVHLVAVVNFGPAPGAAGSVVLARLSFLAVGEGEGALALDTVTLGDSSASAIVVGPITNGVVAVGQPCP